MNRQIVKGAGNIIGNEDKGRNTIQKSILRNNLKAMSQKEKVAQKMIQHTEFDRKTGKKIITMVPQNKEHFEKEKEIYKNILKHKNPNLEYLKEKISHRYQ